MIPTASNAIHALRGRGPRVGARRAGGDHRAQPPGAAHGSRRDGRAARRAIGGGLIDTPAHMRAQPVVGTLPPLRTPATVQFTLGNGLEVVAIARSVAPIVSASLMMRSGADIDPAGREGLASSTAEMLDEGAGTRTALEVAEELEQLGADLYVGAGARRIAADAAGAVERAGACAGDRRRRRDPPPAHRERLGARAERPPHLAGAATRPARGGGERAVRPDIVWRGAPVRPSGRRPGAQRECDNRRRRALRFTSRSGGPTTPRW